MTSRPGLRERKRLDALQRIQRTALDLFDAHGYDAVTVERVAHEASVSPSTVYRYFGTKEQLVIHDDYDPAIIRVLEASSSGGSPLGTLRAALDEVVDQLMAEEEQRIRRRMRYMYDVPAVNAAFLADVAEAESVLRSTFGRQTGLAPEGLEMRVYAGTVLAAMLAALRFWYDAEGRESLVDVVRRTIDLLETTLGAGPAQA
jgi:AcrR family transcriptional regulator